MGVARDSRIGDRQRAAILVTDAARAWSEVLELGQLVAWLEEMLQTDFAAAGAVTVQLQSDSEIAELNSRYRQRQGATDVLSFPGGDQPEAYLGDIAISLPTAQRQAEEEGHSLEVEVKLLSLHGVLHCLGYDHEIDDGEMVRRELALRRRWLSEEAG